MSFTWNLIKVFIMSQKPNFNDRRAGAPKSKILLDLRNLEEKFSPFVEYKVKGSAICFWHERVLDR